MWVQSAVGSEDSPGGDLQPISVLLPGKFSEWRNLEVHEVTKSFRKIEPTCMRAEAHTHIHTHTNTVKYQVENERSKCLLQKEKNTAS